MGSHWESKYKSTTMNNDKSFSFILHFHLTSFKISGAWRAQAFVWSTFLTKTRLINKNDIRENIVKVCKNMIVIVNVCSV